MLLLASTLNGQSSNESQILALENAWNSAQRDHDNKALENLLADTFIDTEADGTVMNKGQFLAYIKDPNVKHLSLNSSDVKVTSYNKMALVTGIYHDKGTENGEVYEVRGRFTDTWVLLNGKWQCAASASTPLPLK
jgi:ketosteroid isomerase-like protein